MQFIAVVKSQYLYFRLKPCIQIEKIYNMKI